MQQLSDKIEYIEYRFVDILGRLKAMLVPCAPADSIDILKKDPKVAAGTSIDGSSVTGLARVQASDLRLEPDLDSLVELPNREQRTAAAMCFIKEKMEPRETHVYFPRDSRGALQVVYDKYLPGDLHLKVKIEPEFHFITADGEPFDYGGYADTFPLNPSAQLLLELATAIQSMGMHPHVIHHEVGAAQQEIELGFDDALRMADNILHFKNITRSLTQEHGLGVTFMPKPFPGGAGNGMHCHLQLWDGEKNLFGSDGGSDLSDTGFSFVAGILHHAAAITAIANPTVNSYKRLVPNHEAPVYVCWGPKNRTALIRVPLFNESQKAAIEFRSPDPMANPYLLFSIIIAAGMDGVNKGMKPPTGIVEDVFTLSNEQLTELDIGVLPSNLGKALDALERDDVIREALGSELLDAFIETKRVEWNDYTNNVITQWEWDMYQSH